MEEKLETWQQPHLIRFSQAIGLVQLRDMPLPRPSLLSHRLGGPDTFGGEVLGQIPQ
jgi:hypothetical protein